ncbi:hypothetical protein [Streptomyces sp. NBC_00986]|uniref:hypothetical protein n=1 Tax=Streptomyces sp. NBC_00986 TaxID=2903702 RepID=UPI00387012B9|nr:hypothetical protein OG504_19800 [Streptomyces sp. NBC_00986]
MSRGEETDEPIAGDDHAVSGEPVDLSKPESAGEPSGPATRHAVVISGDGSAAIDGEPVLLGDGEAVDAAILDRLHGYARDRNTTVTATISDPAAGYVAFVEVAPDGSSTLLEQEGQLPEPAETPEPVPVRPPLGSVEPAEDAVRPEPYGPVVGTGPAGDDDDLDDPDDRADDLALDHGDDELDDDDDARNDGDDDGFDVEAYTLEQERQRRLAGPPPPPSSPTVRPVSKVAPGNGRRQSDDEYASPGLLHKPLVVGPVAIGVAALVIVPLVILGSGSPDDGGRQKQTARSGAETSRSPQAGETAPTGSSTASTPLPLPSATTGSPSARPKTSKGAKAPKSGGGTGSGTGGVAGVTVTVTAKPPRATVTAKPAQDTAATAVNRLHRSDPSGRHICYRAYLTGQGWQKPVCDGTLAGTTSGTHPIQALNIAEYGGAGSAANAFVHNPASTNGQGKWEPQWTAVIGDGKNNYVGSTKAGAPYMTGFAINIGSGQVCRSAIVHGYDWGSSDCTQPRPGYIFGGTLENTRWLEAVKLWI